MNGIELDDDLERKYKTNMLELGTRSIHVDDESIQADNIHEEPLHVESKD